MLDENGMTPPPEGMTHHRIVVLWFRNDLRLHDNMLFSHVSASDTVIPLYVYDKRFLSQGSDQLPMLPRAGSVRRRFLADSVVELQQSLRAMGSELYTVDDLPENVIPAIALRARAHARSVTVVYHREDTHEEQNIERLLGLKLDIISVQVVALAGGISLFHPDDVYWSRPPLNWQTFRSHIERIRVRTPTSAPKKLPPLPVFKVSEADSGAVPVWLLDGSCAAVLVAQDRGQVPLAGGERAGLTRMREYVSKGLSTYKRTRNQLSGTLQSSHLSAWLALGCVSVRTVYAVAKRAERSGCAADHVYKFVFELWWRDFFRFFCAACGPRVFFLSGPARRQRAWRRDEVNIPSDHQKVTAHGVLAC